ncbi:MAG: pilin [bacterium]|nr:pilin [bacterium]
MKKLLILLGAFVLTLSSFSLIQAQADCCDYSAASGCFCRNVSNDDNCKTYNQCLASAPLCSAMTCSNTYGSAIADLEFASCPNSSGVCETPHSKSMTAYCREEVGATRLKRSSVKVCFLHLALTDENAYGEIETPAIVTEYGDLSSQGPTKLLNSVITFITFIAALLLFINIVLAGIKIITGGQDPKNFSDQMKRIVWGVVGLILVALAYLITGFVSGTLFGSGDYLLNPTINEASTGATP